MAYWTAARYMLAQERLALHFLRLAGFEVYLPRLASSGSFAAGGSRSRRRSSPATASLRSSFSGMPRTGRQVRTGW